MCCVKHDCETYLLVTGLAPMLRGQQGRNLGDNDDTTRHLSGSIARRPVRRRPCEGGRLRRWKPSRVGIPPSSRRKRSPKSSPKDSLVPRCYQWYPPAYSAGFLTSCVADFQIGGASNSMAWRAGKPAIQQTGKSALRGRRFLIGTKIH